MATKNTDSINIPTCARHGPLERNENLRNIGSVIGLNRNSVRKAFVKGIDPTSKTGELDMLLIRIFQFLYKFIGFDLNNLRHWLNTYNHHLSGVPMELMIKIQGLVQVALYLEEANARQQDGI